MKTIVTITALVLTMLCSTTAEAQFFKKLQSKIEKKIERKVEQKADRKAEQMLDSVLADKPSKRRKKSRNKGKNNESNAEEAGMDLGGFDLGGMMEAAMNRKPAVIEDTYSFNLTTTMQMTAQGNKPMTVKTSYGNGVHYMQMEKGMSVINDYKNESMITINEDKKTAQAMSLSLMKMFESQDIEVDPSDTADITVKKTGKTKTISGYACEQYLITGSDFKTEGWFTQDINFDIVAHAQSMSELFKTAASEAMMQHEIGFPMEMTTTAGTDGTVTMKILDVSEKRKTIDLSGYKVTSL